MKKYKKLVDLFYEIGSLRRVKRSYVQHVMQDVESVAEHSHRALMIAFYLAHEVGADPYKVLVMTAFHDLPEARTGDANWVQKQYVEHYEDKVEKVQHALMPKKSSKELKKIMEEYTERKSLESRTAKDADILEYVMSLKELEMQGNKEAERRLAEPTLANDQLHTDVAREILDAILVSKPHDWYSPDRAKTHERYKV